MIKNYFKTGIRNIAKHKMFSLLNVIGLAIGMCITLLVIVVLENVSRFDDFQPNKDNIYRVYTEVTNLDGNSIWASTFSELEDELNINKSIDEIVKINSGFNGLVIYNNKEVTFNGYLADSHFFRVFKYEFLSGNPHESLNEPFSVVLTEKTAHKLFGDSNAFGKRITTDYGDMMVRGVIKEAPGNSHFSFDMIGSYATLNSLRNAGEIDTKGWDWNSNKSEYLYLLIKNKDFVKSVENQLDAIAAKINPLKENVSFSFGLHDMNDIILGEQVNRPIGPSFPLLDSLIFLAVTLLILLPACFNYINLSIARSLTRGKEIGVRKIVGGNRKQIIFQFLIETFILSLIALVGSILIVFLIKDEFITMLAPASRLKQINFSAISYFLGIVLTLITSILAGIVPSVFFSKLKPLELLTSKFKPGAFGAFSVRKILIVFQFALSVGFLIGITAVIKQYYHVLNTDMGFNKENVLVVPLEDVKYSLFKQEFSSFAEVNNITFSSHILGLQGSSKTIIRKAGAVDSLNVREIFVDEGFISSMGIKLLKGKDFSQNMPANDEWVVVNRKFEKDLAILNSKHPQDDMIITKEGRTASVIGVVENFNASPMSGKIEPLMLRFNPEKLRYAFLTVQSDNISETCSKLEGAWGTLSETPSKFEFLHHYVEDAFDVYKIMIKVLGFQGVLVMVISCLGLLGMVVFTTENRIKEIGLRKVLGASENELIWLMAKGFIKLLLISAIIGIPISYFLFDFTLSQAQYNYAGINYIEITASLLMLFLLGGLTIYWQTRKVASINPIENLRNE